MLVLKRGISYNNSSVTLIQPANLEGSTNLVTQEKSNWGFTPPSATTAKSPSLGIAST